jgi:RNA polymerase sigma factor (sigma-70 family)
MFDLFHRSPKNSRTPIVCAIEIPSTVDASELPALLDRYERPLVRYAWSILGDLEAARDVVQEAFIRLCGREESGDGSQNVDSGGSHSESSPARHTEAWLFTVTRNLSIDHQRKLSRIVYMPQTDDRTADEPGPGAVLEAQETHDSIFGLLEHLSDNQREVIRLKFQNDLSYKEIAAITQLSVTNVGFLLHTGLKKLRALLEAQPPETLPIPIRQAL